MTNLVQFPGLGLSFEINRVALSIGGFKIYWYGVCIAFGICLALVFAFRHSVEFGVDADSMVDVILIGIVLGIASARAYYVAMAPFKYESIWEMIAIRDGGLAIYDDLFRVGDTISYVLFGSNTIPASAGGSCATGRIVNNKVNSIFNNNYGLYIDVKNGNRNYGIWSNASVIAPACIGNKIKNVYFTGSGYTIDFSQFNIFFVYANQKYSVTLPSASSVATMFGYSTLPSDFACIFTLIYNYNWGNSLVFTNIRNHNGDLASYTLAKGDSITVLCANYPSFHYQILNHSY
jgi:hypothetical protein